MMGKKVHSFRGYELPNIVMKEGEHLSGSIKCDMILWQCVADKFIEMIIDAEISCVTSNSTRKSQVRSRLTIIEENALNYAGGFIVRKVIVIYNKKKEPRYHASRGCLTSLLLHTDTSDADIECGSFYDYTRVWIDKVDRGGLHHISDLCHELFYEIDQCVYAKLQNNLESKNKIAMEEIKHDAFVNTDVQRIWKLCSTHVEEEEGCEILRTIINEWIILRGHSLTSKYMEDYRRAKRDGTKKKGTRKELKLQATT